MLATLRIPAVVMGVGAGSLIATVVAVVVGSLLGLAGLEPGAGLAASILAGFAGGGYVAGKGAVVGHRFHGAVAGLLIAGLVVAIARLGGSPAPTPQVLLLAGFGVVAGGAGGTVAGRRVGS